MCFAKAHRTEISRMNFSCGFSFSFNLPCSFLPTLEAETAEEQQSVDEGRASSRCHAEKARVL